MARLFKDSLIGLARLFESAFFRKEVAELQQVPTPMRTIDP
jgi:hypothetical protein